MQRIQLAVQLKGKGTTRKFQGRDHRVFPAVLVQSQILNNNLGATFLPADAFTDDWAEAANMAPVVVDHPTSRGQPITAKNADVFDAMGVGLLFNARVEDLSLKGDVFIDPSRDVEGLDAILEKLDNGETVELSTGFPVAVEERKGAHNGEDFDVVIRPTGFDHLAIFADKIGACSVDDGCGLGINGCKCGGKKHPKPKPAENEPKPAANRFAKTVDALLALYKRVVGDVDNESDEDRRRMLSDALRNSFGGPGKDVFVDSVFSDDQQVVFEIMSQQSGVSLFRSGFSVDSDGAVTFTDPVPVRRVTVFEPAANESGEPNTKESIMDRNQMIAHLASKGTPKDAAEKLSDEQLATLCGQAGNTDAQNDSEAWRRATMYRRELDELKAATAKAVENQERERASLIDDILYAEIRPWSDEHVRNADIDELKRIHQAVCRKNDYAGRGGPRTGSSVLSIERKSVLAGHNSVLTKKEA